MRIHWKSMEINFRALSLRSTGILLVFCWYPFGRNQKFYSQPTRQPANPSTRQPANPPTRQPASQPASQPTTWGLCSLQGKPTFFIDLVANPGATFQNGPFRTSCFATSIMEYCFFLPRLPLCMCVVARSVYLHLFESWLGKAYIR